MVKDGSGNHGGEIKKKQNYLMDGRFCQRL